MSIRAESEPYTALNWYRLYLRCVEGQERARQLGHPLLVSTILPCAPIDPLAFFDAGSQHERVFWASPSQDYELAGIGTAWAIEATGEARFDTVRSAWQQLSQHALVDESLVAAGPLLLGGFAFDPTRERTAQWADFPDARFILPRFLLSRIEGRSWLTINLLIAPDAELPDPTAELDALLRKAQSPLNTMPVASAPQTHDVLDPEHWMAIVGGAVARLNHGDMQKVVLARESRLHSETPFSITDTLARLRAGYPSCFTFAIDRGSSCFLGASPERLVSLRGGRVWATALAGSIARGATPEVDRQLGEQLLSDTKERHEHAIVFHALRDGLAQLCEHLTAPDEPTLLKVSNVQHLYTPIAGRVRAGVSVIDLVARLHPTPAVGGEPRADALALIREIEELDRGWYAGPVGWIDATGGGEFAVALRSGLLHGNNAALFAGCGIVADSNPDNELAESRMKLRPMRGALGASER